MANYGVDDVEQAMYHTALLGQQNPTLDAVTKMAALLQNQYELERKLGKAAVPEKSFGAEAPNIIQRLLAGNRPVDVRSATDVGGKLDTGMWQPSVSGGTAAPGEIPTEFFSPAQPATIGTEMAKALLPSVEMGQPGTEDLVSKMISGLATPLEAASAVNRNTPLDPLTRQRLAEKLTAQTGGKASVDENGKPIKIPYTADDIPSEVPAKVAAMYNTMLTDKSTLMEDLAKVLSLNAQAGRSTAEAEKTQMEIQKLREDLDRMKLFTKMAEERNKKKKGESTPTDTTIPTFEYDPKSKKVIKK